jgi:RimJ/RimL family protein N-acetyltransferase
VDSTSIKKDGKIGIRQFQPQDAPLLFGAVRESIADICHYMTWCWPEYSLDDSHAFIAKSNADWEQGKQYNFAIVDLRDELLLGAVGMNRLDRVNRSANVGYWVRSTKTGRGIATAALRLLAAHGLNDLGFHRLEVLIPTDNPASRRVAEKAGAQFEGVLRNRVVLANKLHHACLYSLIPEDVSSQVAHLLKEERINTVSL